LRAVIPCGTLIVLLLLAVVSPPLVSAAAARQMRIQASVNSTQTDLGIEVLISGRVSEPDNSSVSNAVVSIQLDNPEGTSVHVAIAYTDAAGVFQDSVPLASNSLAGNYTAFLVRISQVTPQPASLSPSLSCRQTSRLNLR